tara:strand:+ start:217 stop:357 length:141 start_codon:yes stop_codon:yes gene_type:complete
MEHIRGGMSLYKQLADKYLDKLPSISTNTRMIYIIIATAREIVTFL